MRDNVIFKFLKDHFYDEKFANNKKMYVIQCSIATLIVFFVLMTLSIVSSDLVIASIASTTFIVFAMPHAERAKTRYVIGGYIVGMLMGGMSEALMLLAQDVIPSLQSHFDEIFGALAIGGSIFLMVVLDLEHPPASAVSLALVINTWNIWTLVVTVVSLFILTLSRYLLRHKLIDLL